MKKITRREFVKASSAAAGTLLGAGTLGVLALPAPAGAANIQYVESSCESSGKKILICYESLLGSTSEVAEQMADTLCKSGARVDVRKIEHVENLHNYQGAIIGSSVKSSSWHTNAIDFVKSNQEALKKIPVAYFLTCLALYHDTTEANQLSLTYFNPVLEIVPDIKPVCMRGFSGKLDYSKMNVMMRTIMKSKMKKKGIPEGDFRDFDMIRSWVGKTVWPIMNQA